jgi:hypothetical protein
MAEPKTYVAKICGTVGLLENHLTVENLKNGIDKEALDDEWKKTCLLDEKGLYILSSWIEGAMRDAGSSIKLKGHATAKKLVLSGVLLMVDKVRVETAEAVKTLDDIEDLGWIDERIVRVPPRTGARVPRRRVLIPEGWTAEFPLLVQDSFVIDEKLLRLILEAAGMNGIGDYRPKFGRFELISLEASV